MLSFHFTLCYPWPQHVVFDLEFSIPLAVSLKSGLEQLGDLMKALCQVFKGT